MKKFLLLVFIFEKRGDKLAFSGLYFLFDDQYSKNYGLTISSINGNNTEETSGGSNVEIFSDSVYRKPKKYIYGSSPEDVLSFDMEILSETPVVGMKRSKIQKWLFGRSSPCKLQIIQPDLQDIYFNCYLLDSSLIYISNECYGFRFTVECDSPWAWQIAKTYTFRNFDRHINFYNDSDNTDYTYPIIELKANVQIIGDGSIKIINHSDNDREFYMWGLKPNETITIDGEIQSMLSSEGRLLSGNFNKQFFRLVASLNDLEIIGEIQYIKLTYNNARKVGG